MSGNPIINIDIVADASRATHGLDQVSTKMDGFNAGMKKAAIPAAAVLGGLVLMGKAAEESASRLEQSRGAIDKVFGGATAAKVNQWGKDAATNMGLSTAAYQEFASVSGAMLQNLGFNQENAAATSDQLIQRGADLAATFGGETSVAVEAMGAALRGEFDSMEQFGVKLSAAGVQAEVAAEKNAGLTYESDNAATAAATLKLIMEGSASSLGAYAAEADTAAGSQATANAQWENAKASLGEKLLPVFATAAGLLSTLLGWVDKNRGAAETFAVVIGTVAAAVLAYNAGVAIAAGLTNAWKVATGLATGAQWLLNGALWASPFGVVLAMVAALAAVIYTVITHIKQLKQELSELARGDFSSQRVPIVLNGIRMPPGGRGVPGTPAGLVADLPLAGRMSAALALDVAPAGLVMGRQGALANVTMIVPDRAANTAGTTITINGALDPEAVARQIQTMLRQAERRTGSVTVRSL